MKSILALIMILTISHAGLAAGKASGEGSAKKPTPSAKRASKSAKLGTSFKFDGSALRGKYQTSMGTAATVENDKLLDDLLKGRTEFKDRTEQESQRN